MLKGTLDDFTLPDVFRLMSFSRKTGRLDITRRAGQGKVFFRDGEVYFAETSISREALGQKLIRAKLLTEGQLNRALDQNATTGARVGEILVDQGLLTVEQIEGTVRLQIEDAVFDLLRWELGDFIWNPGVEVEPEVFISVSVENLIMEAARRLDELEVIKRKIPSLGTILVMAPTPPEGAVEINITPDEWRILVLVDGTRSVGDIANTFGLDEFSAMRTFYGLVSAGLVEVVGDDSTGPAPEHFTRPPAPPPPPDHPFVPPAPEMKTTSPAEEETAAFVTDPTIDPDDGSVLDPVIEADHPDSAAPSIELGEEPEVQEAEAPAEWFEDPAFPVEVFDEPRPGDLVVEVLEGEQDSDDPAPTDETSAIPEMTVEAAAADDDDDDDDEGSPPALEVTEPDSEVDVTRADEELAPEEAAGSEAVDVEGEDVDPDVTAEADVAAATPDSLDPVEGFTVDRATAQRELARLFGEDKPKGSRPGSPGTPPHGPAHSSLSSAAPTPSSTPGSTPSSTESAPSSTLGPPAVPRRVEDDAQVTKGLISRLIDGVKGL